jgi:hypothetical protein
MPILSKCLILQEETQNQSSTSLNMLKRKPERLPTKSGELMKGYIFCEARPDLIFDTQGHKRPEGEAASNQRRYLEVAENPFNGQNIILELDVAVEIY